MKLRFILLALLIAIPLYAKAQLAQTGAGLGKPAVISYQGPGDVKSGALAWGSCARAYTAAFAATLAAICDVVDTSTGLTTCTFHIQATGFVNPSECNATACATACSVTKVYDQTGNTTGWTQATRSSMPTVVFGAINGLPAMGSVLASNTFLAGATNISQAVPWTMYAVSKRTGSTTTAQAVFSGNTSGQLKLGYTSSANTADISDVTSLPGAASDNAFHVLQGLANTTTANSILNVDGVDGTAGNAGTNNTFAGTPQPTRAFRGASGAPASLTGQAVEFGMWASTSSTDRTNLYNNAHGTNGYNGGV